MNLNEEQLKSSDVNLEELNKQLFVNILSFYKELSDCQESLGNDFEKVLKENLWSLYES